jgi:hypothetical protein
MTTNSTSNCSESLTNNIAQEADNKLQKKRVTFTALYKPHKEISVWWCSKKYADITHSHN